MRAGEAFLQRKGHPGGVQSRRCLVGWQCRSPLWLHCHTTSAAAELNDGEIAEATGTTRRPSIVDERSVLVPRPCTAIFCLYNRYALRYVPQPANAAKGTGPIHLTANIAEMSFTSCRESRAPVILRKAPETAAGDRRGVSGTKASGDRLPVEGASKRVLRAAHDIAEFGYFITSPSPATPDLPSRFIAVRGPRSNLGTH